jgi:hypothetical protein
MAVLSGSKANDFRQRWQYNDPIFKYLDFSIPFFKKKFLL